MAETLFQKLQKASSEEDVKAIYIKALGLKNVQRNLIDIQTKEIWFEAKEGSKVSTYAMFTQLLHYIQVALNDGEHVPPFLCVIDSVKAAIMKTEIVIPFLQKKTIKWGKSASSYTQEALDAVSSFIGTHFVSFRIETQEEEFINTVKNAIKTGEIIRTQITPSNLRQVYDKWVNMIGREIRNISPDKYSLLFFADIMSDGTVSTHNLPAELIHSNGKPTFLLDGVKYELGNLNGYNQFWTIYDRPPKEEYRNYLLERRDSLIPLDERQFKGAYYTPLTVVDKAYDYLAETLGANWQKEYIVWDMCCGVGNLETKHSNHRNLYMSTLDQSDVDVMMATKTCTRAERFQYDYLNDDIADDGSIDYNLTNKLPQSLRTAIANANAHKPGAKKILVLINPPYGEATNASNTASGKEAKNKENIKRTKMAEVGMKEYGNKSSDELFIQFVARIAKEIPTATLAMFSKIKYLNAQESSDFRKVWNAKYLNGFVMHNKVFDGLKGNYPIGFLIWKTDNRTDAVRTEISEIQCDTFDKKLTPIGSKTFYNIDVSTYLSKWIDRPKPNKEKCIPLTNCVTPPEKRGKDQRGEKWSDGAIGYLSTGGNDFANQKYINIMSSAASRGHGIFVNAENLWQCAVYFTMTKIISPSWLNDRDQFLQPSEELSDEFKDDCLVWMLFNHSNLTASADGLKWEGQDYSIVNHFIPFTEDEVDAPSRFESDFMVEYMDGKDFSEEAQAVLDAGRDIWKAYFSMTDEYTIRNEYKLDRCDVGWYQIRKALEARNKSGNYPKVNFSKLEEAYKILTDKLRPCVVELGFLKGEHSEKKESSDQTSITSPQNNTKMRVPHRHILRDADGNPIDTKTIVIHKPSYQSFGEHLGPLYIVYDWLTEQFGYKGRNLSQSEIQWWKDFVSSKEVIDDFFDDNMAYSKPGGWTSSSPWELTIKHMGREKTIVVGPLENIPFAERHMHRR